MSEYLDQAVRWIAGYYEVAPKYGVLILTGYAVVMVLIGAGACWRIFITPLSRRIRQRV